MAAISNLKKREKLINDESQDMNVAISRKFLQVFLIWLKFCKFIFRNWTKKLKTDRVPFRCTAAVRQIVFHQMISSHITYVGHCQRKASQVLLPYEQYKSGHLLTHNLAHRGQSMSRHVSLTVPYKKDKSCCLKWKLNKLEIST